MKRILLVMGLGLFYISIAFAVMTPKVGFIDLQKALNQCDAGKIAKETFNKRVDVMQKQLDEKQNELKKMLEELEKQKGLLTSEARGEKEKIYQQKIKDAQEFAKDAQEELQQLDAKLTKAILIGLRDTIRELGNEGSFTVILEGPSREALEKIKSKTDKEIKDESFIPYYAKNVGIADAKNLDYQTAEDITLKTIKMFNKSNNSKELIETFYIESPSPTTQYIEKPVLAANSNPIIFSTLIKSDVDELPTTKAKPNKNAYAIVIGIEQYRQKLPKADFAAHDAQTMTEYLTTVMGYPEENVVTLLNEHATNVDFAKYFEKWLPNNIEKDSSVFIYYSGHGAPNPKTGDAYLVPYDGDPSFIDQTGYSLKRLYDSLGKLQAKEIVVALDSCFSGAGGRSVLAKGARPLVMNMKDSAIPAKVVVLSAASREQMSSTYDEKGHGLFTYFMLKGLKSEAETNGSVEIGNLFEYIKPQVERIARKIYNNEQTPQLIAPKELTGMKLR